jgi:hypothetical protein
VSLCQGVPVVWVFMRSLGILLCTVLPLAMTLIDCGSKYVDDSVDGAAPDARDDSTTVTTLDAGPPLDTGATRRCDPSKPFGTPTKFDSLNQSGFYSANPALTKDELTVYFVRRDLNIDGAASNYDIYVATRANANEPFGPANRIDELATLGTEGSVWWANNTLYFGRTANGQTKIYFATRGANNFGNIGPLDFPDSGASSTFYFPWVRDDGSLMYFVGGSGTSQDLYRISLPYSAGALPQPITELSSGEIETSPRLSSDERSIYFSSSRGPVLGKRDVWVATRLNVADPFGTPKRDDTLSSIDDDYPSWLSEDSCLMYLTRIDAADVFTVYLARRPL